MIKVIKEELTETIWETIKENEKEFEEKFADMSETYSRLIPLLKQVKALKYKTEQTSSTVFDNTIRIDNLEKKVEKIIEYLEKEQKKK